MKNSNSMTLALASLMLTLPSVHANASELDAHEHGSANLDIAIDTSTIEMRFESPAVNIVGFEYATEDEQQLLLINKAKSNLSNFDLIYGLVGDVSCQTVKSSAKWRLGRQISASKGCPSASVAITSSQELFEATHSSAGRRLSTCSDRTKCRPHRAKRAVEIVAVCSPAGGFLNSST